MLSWYRCAMLLFRDSYDLVTFFHLAALSSENAILVLAPSMAPGKVDSDEVSDAGLV
jgi:hypothetical protein